MVLAAQTGCVGRTAQSGAFERIHPVNHTPALTSASESGIISSDTHPLHTVGDHQPLGFASVAGVGIAVRWHDRVQRPVRIRVENADGISGWSPDDRQMIQGAVTAWEHQGAPVRFVLVSATDTAADADVVVHWVDRFSTGVCGWTKVQWDSAREIHHGDVQLSLRTPDGRLLTRDERRILATHEFGHVLGLGHSRDAASIMSPVIYTTGIGQPDVVSLQWLYQPVYAIAR